MPKKDASKAEFVRGLPPTMSAKDVVDKAKEAGFKLTPAYVYVIRSQARTGTRKKTTPATGAPRDAEARLIAVASELGLTRSIELLTREKERVMRILR
jgi:phage terminase small subunit